MNWYQIGNITDHEPWCNLKQSIWFGIYPPTCSCKMFTGIVSTTSQRKITYTHRQKIKIKKENGVWWIISPCGNFKEQYVSYSQVLQRLREIK